MVGLSSGTITCHVTARKRKVSTVKLYARLAQSVEHETLNLRVVGSSPTLGVNFFFLYYFFMLKLLLQSVIG